MRPNNEDQMSGRRNRVQNDGVLRKVGGGERGEQKHVAYVAFLVYYCRLVSFFHSGYGDHGKSYRYLNKGLPYKRDNMKIRGEGLSSILHLWKVTVNGLGLCPSV